VLHRRPIDKGRQRALHQREAVELHQLARAIKAHEVAHPRENGDVGDGVFLAHDPAAARQALLEHAEKASGACGDAVTRELVFVVFASKLVKETELANHWPHAALLQYQPLRRCVARGRSWSAASRQLQPVRRAPRKKMRGMAVRRGDVACVGRVCPAC
jgi:hypothetical protein